MNLLTILTNILNALKNLQSRKNLYYYKNVTVANQYGKTINMCDITLPSTGIYLVLGGVAVSISSTNTSLANIATRTNCTSLISSCGRGSMDAGGGVQAWALVEVTSPNGVVSLTTYGYQNSTYNLYGHLLAIKLLR